MQKTNKLKLIGFSGYLDGGTIELLTEYEIYCIDKRIRSKTKGFVYLGYPKDDNSNMAQNQDRIKEKLIACVETADDSIFKEHKFDFRSSIIKELGFSN